MAKVIKQSKSAARESLTTEEEAKRLSSDLVVASLAATLRVAGNAYRAMATRISATIAVTPYHVIEQASAVPGWDRTFELNQTQLPKNGIRARIGEIDQSRDFAVLRLAETAGVQFAKPMVAVDPGPIGAYWSSRVAAHSFLPEIIEGSFAGVMQAGSAEYLRLTIDEKHKDMPLAGISGAPVVIDGKLAGIAAAVDKTGALLAIPMSALIDSEKTSVVRDQLVVSPIYTSIEVNQETGEIRQWPLDSFSKEVKTVLSRAIQISQRERAKEVHTDYLLLALAAQTGGQLAAILSAAKVDLREVLEGRFGWLTADFGQTAAEFAGMPQLSENARSAVQRAIERANADGRERIEVAHLLYGVLSTAESPDIARLNARGITAANVRLPLAGAVLPGYQSDDPVGADLLGITDEVKALASVMAAKTVEPPLSLGLFGDWGTGKSFFMHKLEEEIDALQARAKTDEEGGKTSPYCRDIVQISFNAWNYIDSNLWASLTAEIFEGLAKAIAIRREVEDSPEERALILAAASSSQSAMDEATKRRDHAQQRLKDAEKKLTELQASDAAIAASLRPMELLAQAGRMAVHEEVVKEPLKEAARAMHMPEAEAQGLQVQKQILELDNMWSTIFFTLKKDRSLWMWIVALGVFVVVASIVSVLVFEWNLKALGAAVVSSLTAASLVLAPVLRTSRTVFGFVERAKKSKQELIDAHKKKQTEELTRQQKELQEHLGAAEAELKRASAKAEELSRQVENMQADKRMSDYIRLRHQSSDYTQHLGIIARVRSDFRQLSVLLRAVREEGKSGGGDRAAAEMLRRQREKNSEREVEGKPELFPRIDRIVLYIDDLDRCPEETVVNVLQAVHLLLAFPLFVVVVGVDPRWLLYSLQQSSSAFKGEKSEGSAENEGVEAEHQWRSTPLNYLEKVFQIPFTLRPIGRAGFENLVDRYASQPVWALASSAASEKRVKETDSSSKAAEKTEVGAKEQEGTSQTSEAETTEGPRVQLPPDEQKRAATSEPRREIPPEPDPAPEHLNISETERTFMKELHEFIPSPRAGKRFINIYRLLRASVKERDRGMFLGGEQGGPYQAPMTLLAILTGYPDQATEILRELVQRPTAGTWESFCGELESRFLETPNGENDTESASEAKKAREAKGNEGAGSERDRVGGEELNLGVDREEWAKLLKELRSLEGKVGGREMREFGEWAPRVARYSFQSGRVLYYQHE